LLDLFKVLFVLSLATAENGFRNPARIHSPDPFLRAGEFSRGFAKSFSPENSFGKTESAFEFRQFLP